MMKNVKPLTKLIWFLVCAIAFIVFMYKDMFISGAIVLVVAFIGYCVIDIYFKKRKGRNG
jgi:membrane protein YdbS with pleckstrin-like domain